jgi:pyridoxine 5-phosphate synthase
MARLCVNIDHVATVRNARAIEEPDPLAAAIACELAGAIGITFHLREDRRHITDRDATHLRSVARGLLNMEMACTPEMLRIALAVHPDQVTYVPEKREEVTTEGGLDVSHNIKSLTDDTKKLRAAGIAVSMFIDPDHAQIDASCEVGATHIELHTGRYCEAYDRHPEQARRELHALQVAAAYAISLGMVVNAGHGLNYRNVVPVARIAGMNELNIGHAIVGRALFVGLDRAVRDMIALIS